METPTSDLSRSTLTSIRAVDPADGRARMEAWAADVPFGIAGVGRECHRAWTLLQTGKTDVVCYYH